MKEAFNKKNLSGVNGSFLALIKLTHKALLLSAQNSVGNCKESLSSSTKTFFFLSNVPKIEKEIRILESIL